MTPRMIETTAEAIAQIGKYVVVKNDKTGSFRTDLVVYVSSRFKKDTATHHLHTANGYGLQMNAYTRVYESYHEAEEALASLMERKRKENEQ